jgi:hypothetical protein
VFDRIKLRQERRERDAINDAVLTYKRIGMCTQWPLPGAAFARLLSRSFFALPSCTSYQARGGGKFAASAAHATAMVSSP